MIKYAFRATAPSPPPTGFVRIFADGTGTLLRQSSDGSTAAIGAGGGGGGSGTFSLDDGDASASGTFYFDDGGA